MGDFEPIPLYSILLPLSLPQFKKTINLFSLLMTSIQSSPLISNVMVFLYDFLLALFILSEKFYIFAWFWIFWFWKFFTLNLRVSEWFFCCGSNPRDSPFNGLASRILIQRELGFGELLGKQKENWIRRPCVRRQKPYLYINKVPYGFVMVCLI